MTYLERFQEQQQAQERAREEASKRESVANLSERHAYDYAEFDWGKYLEGEEVEDGNE